jgi:drug/metabolite transporter (DMT)-like permease
VLTLLEPLVAVLIGALVWHERLDLAAFVGAGLVLAGAATVMRV